MKTTNVVCAALVAAASVQAVPFAEPPTVVKRVPVPSPTGIASSSSAKSKLKALTVAESGSTDGYSRDLFPHWITQSGKCDTRDVVLKRDGTDVVQSSSTCSATSGNWKSPYDGASHDTASEIQIDHMVPLENAWVSGASDWTTDQREAYANDLTRPQLWAVTSGVNESKGDRSPDEWKPPLSSFYCTYAEAWVTVKSYYNLTATSAEVATLGDMLDTC